MADFEITGTIHHQAQTRTGTITVASSETEQGFNLEKTDMYKLVNADGKEFFFPAISSVVEKHDI